MKSYGHGGCGSLDQRRYSSIRSRRWATSGLQGELQAVEERTKRHHLNDALRSQIDIQFKSSLLQTPKEIDMVIHEYEGEDHLQPWLECIKWVGGISSRRGLFYTSHHL